MNYDKPCRISNDSVSDSCLSKGLTDWGDHYELQLEIPFALRMSCVVFIRSSRLYISGTFECGEGDLLGDYILPADADRDKIIAVRTLTGLTIILPKTEQGVSVQYIRISG